VRPCGKIWLASSVCAIFIVATVVSTSIFVILPRVAQHILDTTTIALPNSTLVPCNSLHAALVNSAVISVAGPFTATLHPYRAKLSTTTCGAGLEIHGGLGCENPNSTDLGTFMAPEMDLRPGPSHVQFTVGLDLFNQHSLKDGFVIPMLRHSKAMLTIASDDAKMTVLGIKITGLRIKNHLECSHVTSLPPGNAPSDVCRLSSSYLQSNKTTGRRLDDNSGYVMHCTDHIQRNLTMVV